MSDNLVTALIIDPDESEELDTTPETALPLLITDDFTTLRNIVGGPLDTVCGWGRHSSRRVTFWRCDDSANLAPNPIANLKTGRRRG